VGKVIRPHGRGGLLRILSYARSEASFLDARSVFIRSVLGQLDEYTVASVRPHKKVFLMELNGLSSKVDAEKYRGAEIFIRKAALTREKDEFFWYELLGVGVYLETGAYLGCVTQIIPTGSNDIYVVKKGEKETLVPATHEVVKGIDLEKREMIISPIKGLLDLSNEV